MTRGRRQVGTFAAFMTMASGALVGGFAPAEPQGMTASESSMIEARLARIERAQDRMEDRQWWALILTGGASGAGATVATTLVHRRRTRSSP
jgi:hypothetical protein